MVGVCGRGKMTRSTTCCPRFGLQQIRSVLFLLVEYRQNSANTESRRSASLGYGSQNPHVQVRRLDWSHVSKLSWKGDKMGQTYILAFSE